MRWLALLTPIVLAAVVCGGSNAQEPIATGSIALVRGSNVWVMKADGTGQRSLIKGGAPAWSRDGRQLTYGVRGRNGGVHLAVVDANGSKPRRLTRPEADYELDLDPVWSPDGRRIVFTRYDSDPNYALHIVDVRATRERKLTPWFWPRGAFAVTRVDNRGARFADYAWSDLRRERGRERPRATDRERRSGVRRTARLVTRRSVDRVHDQP